MPWRKTAGQTAIAFTCARQPPASNLSRLTWVAKIDDNPDLIILRVGRMKVRHAGREMRELAIDEPQVVYAARLGARGVEERQTQILETLRR